MNVIAVLTEIVSVINEIKAVKVALGYTPDTPLVKIVQDALQALKGLDVDKPE